MNNTSNSRLSYLSLLGILALSAIIYSPTLKAYFITDDFMWINIIADKGWQAIPSFFTKLSGVRFFRPFIKLAFWFDYSTYGLDQTGYHLTNLILHSVNTILVFSLCYIISRNWNVTAIATLIFALHPMHTESISYISGRTELTHALFFLTSLICFIKYLNAKESKGLYYGSIIAFIFSLLTKETAVCLVAVLFLSELFIRYEQNEGGGLLKNRQRYIPYLLILICYIILRQFVIKANVYPIRYDNIWFRPIFYFIKVFAPINMHSFAQQGLVIKSITALSFILILGSVFYCLYDDLKSHKRLILYCILWIVIIFFPVYFNPGERYAYLPSIGSSMILALIINQGMQKLKHRNAAGAYVGLAAIIIGIVSFSYIRIAERNAVFFKVGEIARRAVSQMISLRPEIPENAVLYFINPPEIWIRESEIWTRPFFLTFDDAIRTSYHNPSLKIYYNQDNSLAKTEDKISFLLNNDFEKKMEGNIETLVFEYQQNNLVEKTALFRQLLAKTPK